MARAIQNRQFGDVAQLGERTVRIRKVESSILFVSTKKVAKLKGLATFFIIFWEVSRPENLTFLLFF